MNSRDDLSSAILDSYRPALVPLTHNLTAAVFPLMKIFPAAFCVRRAAEEGLISGDSLIVETSSGNLALGLAIVCRLYGYRLTIVSDYACDDSLRRRMEDLGTTVEIVAGPAKQGGYQGARLQRIDQLRSLTPDSWWLNQYDNPSNPGAYGSVVADLVSNLGKVDCIVGSVGSGGSLCGTTGYLRTLFPNAKAVAVDTFGSVLFGHPDSPRELRGLGNSIFPRNLDHTLIDEVHWVNAAEAYNATRYLHKRTCLFCGGTSGAAWLVARYWAEMHPDLRVVCICPDDGYRYLDTIYNDSYLASKNLLLDELPRRPAQVKDPADAAGSWSFIKWDRRELAEVRKLPQQAAAWT